MDLKTVSVKKMASTSEKPKRRSAYILYSNDVRAEVKKNNPGLRTHEYVVIMSKMWLDLKEKNPELAQKYIDLANDMKTNQSNADEPHDDGNNSNDKITGNENEEEDDVGSSSSKRKKSAWTLYLRAHEKEYMKNNPKMKKRELNAKLKIEWQKHVANKDEVMHKYVDMANNYLLTVASTSSDENNSNGDNEQQKHLDETEHTEQKQQTQQTEPKKVAFSDVVVTNILPPISPVHEHIHSAFELFCMENRAKVRFDNMHLTPREITRLLFKLWHKKQNDGKI